MIEYEIAAAPEKVYEALTEKEHAEAWSGQPFEMELAIAGTYIMFDGWAYGKLISFKKGKNLTYTWQTTDDTTDVAPTIVEFKFFHTSVGTRIELKHSGFADDTEQENHRKGWFSYVLEPLSQYLAGN